MLRPQSESAFSDLWVVFDFVDLDLRKLIASPQTITVRPRRDVAEISPRCCPDLAQIRRDPPRSAENSPRFAEISRISCLLAAD